MPARKKMSKKSSRKTVSFTRNRKVFKGSGDYSYSKPGPVGKFGRYLGRHIGRYAVGPSGGNLGESIGGLLHYPAKFFGSGDYGVSNMPTESMIAPQLPKFENNKNEYVTIAHREYLGDLYTSAVAGETKIQSFGLNPAVYHTFPWLSELAQSNFQQYKFDGMIFEYRSFSADALNSTNTALGSVFAAINYDYSDADLSSRAQIENCDWSAACKPSESMIIPVECDAKQTSMNGLLYILNTPTSVPVGTDPKTYYLGKLFIGTTGFQGTNVNCGSLYVTYKIRLYKPFLAKPLSNGNIISRYRTGVTDALPFGTGFLGSEFECDTLGTIITGTTMTISSRNLQPGARYLLMLRWTGASTANIVLPFFSSNGPISGLGTFNNGGGPYTSAVATNPILSGSVTDLSGCTIFEFEMADTVDAPVVLTLGTGGTLPTGSSLQIYMIQRNGNNSKNIGILPYIAN